MKKLLLAGSVILTSGNALAKNINIATNPLSLLSNELTGSVDYAINPYTALGAEAGYIFNSPGSALSGYKTSGFELGVRASFHQNHFDGDGFYGLVGMAYGTLSIKNDSNDLARISAVAPRIIGGYQWAWDEGLNMKLGAGLRHIMFSESKIFNNELSIPNTTTVSVELQIGYLI